MKKFWKLVIYVCVLHVIARLLVDCSAQCSARHFSTHSDHFLLLICVKKSEKYCYSNSFADSERAEWSGWYIFFIAPAGTSNWWTMSVLGFPKHFYCRQKIGFETVDRSVSSPSGFDASNKKRSPSTSRCGNVDGLALLPTGFLCCVGRSGCIITVRDLSVCLQWKNY